MRILFFILSFVSLLFLNGAKTLVHLNFAIHRNEIARELCVERDVEASCCKGSCVLKWRLESIENPIENAPKSIHITAPELLAFFPASMPAHDSSPLLWLVAPEIPRSFGSTSRGFAFPEPHPPSC